MANLLASPTLMFLILMALQAQAQFSNFTVLTTCYLNATGATPACSLMPAQATMMLQPGQAATIPFVNKASNFLGVAYTGFTANVLVSNPSGASIKAGVPLLGILSPLSWKIQRNDGPVMGVCALMDQVHACLAACMACMVWYWYDTIYCIRVTDMGFERKRQAVGRARGPPFACHG